MYINIPVRYRFICTHIIGVFELIHFSICDLIFIDVAWLLYYIFFSVGDPLSMKKRIFMMNITTES